LKICGIGTFCHSRYPICPVVPLNTCKSRMVGFLPHDVVFCPEDRRKRIISRERRPLLLGGCYGLVEKALKEKFAIPQLVEANYSTP